MAAEAGGDGSHSSGRGVAANSGLPKPGEHLPVLAIGLLSSHSAFEIDQDPALYLPRHDLLRRRRQLFQ